MSFLQNRIGQGPFVRMDVGPALAVIESSDDFEATSNWGWGFLGGVGYGLPVTSGTRLLFQINYGLHRVGGDTILGECGNFRWWKGDLIAPHVVGITFGFSLYDVAKTALTTRTRKS